MAAAVQQLIAVEAEPDQRSAVNGASNIVPFSDARDREYLCYFYHRHLDFRIPEVEALAEVAGDSSSRSCR